MKESIEFESISIFRAIYRTPVVIGKWEFKNISISESPYQEFLKDYESKNLIFKKIGKYK